MYFYIDQYVDKFRHECIEKRVWACSWGESFRGCGFSSYRFTDVDTTGDDTTGNGLHYLSDEEFLIFVLRYS